MSFYIKTAVEIKQREMNVHIISCFLIVLSTRSIHASKECPNIFEPENGRLEITSQGNLHLSSASFMCDPGYQIHGSIKLCCSDGVWVNSTTVATNCVPEVNGAISCDSPLTNKNDVRYHYLTIQGTFANGGILNLKCLSVDGYDNDLETQTLSCMDGVWDQTPIECLGPPIPTDTPMINLSTKSDSNILWYVIAGVGALVLCILGCVGVYIMRRPPKSPHVYSTPATPPGDRSYTNPGLPEEYEMISDENTLSRTKSNKIRYEVPEPASYATQLPHEYNYVTPITPTISPSDVDMGEEIGKDRGVSLCKGTVLLPGSTRVQDVVVKVSRDDFTRSQMACLRREIDGLQNLTLHQNVINTLAVISNVQTDCIGIVSEYATKGSLRDILHKRKTVVSDYSKSIYQVLTYVKDIAKGLRFLHTQKFLQPHLKASKVLIFSNGVCKISNFGLKKLGTSDNVYDLDQLGEMVRPSWFAPEVVKDKVVSIQSDIWAFGATLYEIFSFGKDPFEGLSDKDVVKTLNIDKDSSQAEKEVFKTQPELCKYPSTQDMFVLIGQCCHWKPSERPGFKVILQRIETALVTASKQDYINFK
ncbi:fibroblast growth factor receptor 2-like [Anneissia japonica]|uniref:fibroblast growth factor receptor 2-like n=1 Tax=Anneissia japonica TaxID=1529436 RepID=UPI001425BAC1|nr:fibroblast growth factor receptor 2-like [Anneissia japonica]